MNTRSRRPAAFPSNDPKVIVAEPEPDDTGSDTIAITPDADPRTLPVPLASPSVRRPLRWGALLWSALAALGVLALGLGVAQLVDALFARSAALGSLGLALAAVAALALVAIIVREARGLLRLSKIEHLRERAAATVVSDHPVASASAVRGATENRHAEGVAVARELLQITSSAPSLARARKTLSDHLGDIIDGADLVRLAERNLMAPLDREARRLVSSAARRVSVVTAVSPRALVDILFVLVTAVGLIRRLAYLYGGRPGTLGMLRLMRQCVAHLTVTGGLAVGDSMVQQMLGHGVVAKLSTRLGEGMLNGLLTARLGLAAIEVMRPLPFVALPQPALSDLAADLLRKVEREV